MEIHNIKIQDITPYENNPRKNENAVEYLSESIKEFGFKVPIVIDKNNVIVAGHTRYLAARELGLSELPCIVADDLTDEQVKAFRLADNKVAEFSSWDFDLLDKELSELAAFDIDMEDFGFGEFFEDMIEEPEELEPEGVEDNYAGDIPKEPKSKYGDIYQLGRHRLMCGDSTIVTDVEKLMNGNKADMVFTDPPYGINITSERIAKNKDGSNDIRNNELRNEGLTDFLSDFISNIQYKEQSSVYICCPWQRQDEFIKAIKRNGLNIKNCIVWDKKNFGLNGFKGYRPQYELIYFCCKDSFNWYGDLGQSDVLRISREIKREEQGNHPTPKPIELISVALKNSSKENDIVLDSFGGSGSTLIACEQLNRTCYMMEYEPYYIDVIIDRWEQFTGEKAELIEG